jgi:RHH-type proline utilization regulon transcriptional repressor/proline dehydrogenase/delta 1-pyrroline-5-carboxylate dehydrogenase
MQADTLDHAIELQNGSAFGLTGGIHSLDPTEIGQWMDAVEVGNAYVNRPITGAIVQRQPFGGWKRSVIGPGAKAGGPNYVAQFGTWHTAASAPDDFDEVWAEHFSVEHDPTGLACEANLFRYRPLDRIVLRYGPSTDLTELDLARRAAHVAGVSVIESDTRHESDEALAARLPDLDIERIRLVGVTSGTSLRRAANAAQVHLAHQTPVPQGRVELLHLVREQSVSITRHRFGNPLPGQWPR